MKNQQILKLVFLLTAVVTFFSCEKYNADEGIEAKEANSTLIVRTRAATADGTDSQDEAKVSYPVNVYIFDAESKCIELDVIASEDEELSLKLPEGNYDVYAIAGANEEDYDMPTKENATKDAVIALRDGHKHGDLMTAHSSVTLGSEESNTLTLSLERKVMMLETVTMSNIPDDVTGVSLTISPLHESLLLNGNYSSETGSYTVNLTKGSDGSTWKNTESAYLLEAVGMATFKVTLTRADGLNHSYSYSCQDELKANYKINISGTYKEDDIAIKGTITGATWAGTIDVDFTFNNGVIDDNIPDYAPTVGTLYKDCYVLKSETSGNKTTVTLVTTSYKDKLAFEEGNQESMKTAVDAGIAELAVDEIEGWRLPTLEELKYVKDNKDYINQRLEQYDKPIFSIEDFYGAFSYFYSDSGIIKSYCPYRGDTNNSPGSENEHLILRAFATVVFTK